MTAARTLTDADVEAIASAVVDRLRAAKRERPPRRTRQAEPRTVAKRIDDGRVTLYIGRSTDLAARLSSDTGGHPCHSRARELSDRIAGLSIIVETWACDDDVRAEAWLRDVYGYGAWNSAAIRGRGVGRFVRSRVPGLRLLQRVAA